MYIRRLYCPLWSSGHTSAPSITYMDVSKDLAPPRSLLCGCTSVEKDPSRHHGGAQSAQPKLSFLILRRKRIQMISPRDVQSHDSSMLLSGNAPERMLSVPRLLSPQGQRPDGTGRSWTVSCERARGSCPPVCVRLLPAASAASGDADASPRDPTSHVALRASAPPSSLRLKGRGSTGEG